MVKRTQCDMVSGLKLCEGGRVVGSGRCRVATISEESSESEGVQEGRCSMEGARLGQQRVGALAWLKSCGNTERVAFEVGPVAS
jgi:hypothetical protein